MMDKKWQLAIAAIALAALVIASMLLVFKNESPAPSSNERSPIGFHSAADFTSANGVTSGSGTATNPYVIDGWTILVRGGALAGIYISVVDVHLIIQNVTVVGNTTNPYNPHSDSGVALAKGVSNVAIRHCNFTNLESGIKFLGNDHITVSNNTFRGGNVAVDITTNIFDAEPSTNLTIAGNNMTDNDVGIYASGAARVNVTNNHFKGNRLCMGFDSTNHTVVEGNDAWYVDNQDAIYVNECQDMTILKNRLYTDSHGITVQYSSFVVISENEVYALAIGLFITHTDNLTASSNEFKVDYSWQSINIAIWLDYSERLDVTSNSATDYVHTGIVVVHCSDVTLNNPSMASALIPLVEYP